MLLRRLESESDLESFFELQLTDKAASRFHGCGEIRTATLVDGANCPWKSHGLCTHGTLQATESRQQVFLV